MKKLLIIAVMSLLLTTCSPIAFRSPSTHHTAIIQTTTGQELIDLQAALDSGAITQEEYDELKLKIIERLDAPMDSTNTCN
jgi:hypothetical protein